MRIPVVLIMLFAMISSATFADDLSALIASAQNGNAKAQYALGYDYV